MSFINFHPLVISFSLFLLALRLNGLIQDCWWNSSYCWDQVEKHSSLWRALSLTEVFDDGIFLACRWVPCLSPWSASTKSQTLVFQTCCVLPCSREVRTLFSAEDACSPPVGEVMINGKNSSVLFRLHDKINWVLKPYACSSCSILSLCFSFQNMSGIPAWIFFWLRPCLAAICAYCCCCFSSLNSLALQCFPQPVICP